MTITNAALLPELADYITDTSVRDACYYLCGALAAHSSLSLKVTGSLEGKKTVNFSADNPPFSFIINRGHLLFYFRQPAIQSGRFDFERLQSRWNELKVADNHNSEWTVPIRSIEQALLIWTDITS